MRLRSRATLIAFFFLAAMISHSRVSTMVLVVTPVILSKLGVVAHPAVMNDRKRIDTMLRITVPPDTQRRCKFKCIASAGQAGCVGRATDRQILTARLVDDSGCSCAPLEPLEDERNT